MKKAGLIVGIAAFVLAFAAAAGISPLCGLLCVSPIAGVFAGYLSGVFDKPATGESGAKSGAIGGLIGGVGAFLGQAVAGIVNALFAEQIAAAVGGLFNTAADVESTRVLALGWGLCGGIADIAIMAGLGALGGFLWYQLVGSKTTQAAQPPISPM